LLWNGILWKSDKERRTCNFDDFVEVGWWNTHVYSTTLIRDLSVYIIEALEFIYLVLVQLSQLIWSCMIVLNYVKKMMLVNAYMLIDWDVVGEYIYVNWIVNVVGDCIYVKWWWIVGEYIYAKWLMTMWRRLLIELWLDWLCGRKYLIMQLLLRWST